AQVESIAHAPDVARGEADELSFGLDRPQHCLLLLGDLLEALFPGRGHRRLVPNAVSATNAQVGHPTVVGPEIGLDRQTERRLLSADRSAESHRRQSL